MALAVQARLTESGFLRSRIWNKAEPSTSSLSFHAPYFKSPPRLADIVKQAHAPPVDTKPVQCSLAVRDGVAVKQNPLITLRLFRDWQGESYLSLFSSFRAAMTCDERSIDNIVAAFSTIVDEDGRLAFNALRVMQISART